MSSALQHHRVYAPWIAHRRRRTDGRRCEARTIGPVDGKGGHLRPSHGTAPVNERTITIAGSGRLRKRNQVRRRLIPALPPLRDCWTVPLLLRCRPVTAVAEHTSSASPATTGRRIWRLAIALLVAAGLLLFLGAGTVQALSVRAARVAIAQELRDNFRYGYQPRSLVAPCTVRTRHTVHCDILFADDDGDTWCGNAKVIDHGSYLGVHWRVSMQGCESF
jgi:hypothetical protein